MTSAQTRTLPRLSVVIPSYNQGKFIERTIKSIIDQSYPDLEIILMDGGSTDETMQIVEKYRSHFAHIQSEPDGGQSAAIAAGFEMATGDFMSWLNSDDTYEPRSLWTFGKFFAENPDARFAYAAFNVIDSNDEVIVHKPVPRFNLGVMKYAFLTVAQHAAFWERKLYKQVGGVDPSLRFCMDYDLFVKMAQLSPPLKIAATVSNFRIHDESKTTTLETVRSAEDVIVQQRYCAVNPENRFAFKTVRFLYQLRVASMMALDGSLWRRLAFRYKNQGRSVAS